MKYVHILLLNHVIFTSHDMVKFYIISPTNKMS